MAGFEPAVAQGASRVDLENPCSRCAIRHAGVCGSLDSDELDEFRRIVKPSDFVAGQTIVAEGEPADDLYNVVSGAVRLSKYLPDGRRQITGFIFPGDLLGIALNETYVYSAEAIAPTRLCRFPRRDLERMIKSMRGLGNRLLGEAVNDLVAAQDQMLLLGRKTAQERVASFLLELVARARRRGRDENPVALPMNRTDIADYLGLTAETVSRCFTKLRADEIIRLVQPGSVVILEASRLAALAQGDLLPEH